MKYDIKIPVRKIHPEEVKVMFKLEASVKISIDGSEDGETKEIRNCCQTPTVACQEKIGRGSVLGLRESESDKPKRSTWENTEVRKKQKIAVFCWLKHVRRCRDEQLKA
jgi:hypothetical protein